MVILLALSQQVACWAHQGICDRSVNPQPVGTTGEFCDRQRNAAIRARVTVPSGLKG